jgi:hypothetical protein
MKKIMIALFGLLILTACSSAEPVSTTISPQPTSTAVRVLPTSSAPNDSILWQGLQVTMDQAEITDDFITDFGTTRNPSPGDKFLWVQVLLENVGNTEMDTPPIEHFSALYAAAEFKPTYGHRKDHTDYTSLDSLLFSNQQVDAWLRFDIPVAAELKDLRFVFLPESSHVGVSFSSPNYPYAEDHPAFVWDCRK